MRFFTTEHILTLRWGPAIGSCDSDGAFLRLRAGAPNMYMYIYIYIILFLYIYMWIVLVGFLFLKNYYKIFNHFSPPGSGRLRPFSQVSAQFGFRDLVSFW